MTESRDILKQGELVLKCGSLIQKKHKRWCQLCKEIGEPIYSLECYESKDQRDKLKNSFSLSQVKTIDKVVKESSKDYIIDVNMKKEKFSLIFNNQVETESWYYSLQENCQFCEGREDSSYTGDDDDSGMKDNFLYVSEPEEAARFDVTLKQNDDTKRLNLKSTYRLHVSSVCLMLEDLEKQEPKYKWYYDQLRRYGKTGNDFTIEAGRRSDSGPGIFVFMHEDPGKMLKSINKLTKRKHNEQLSTKLNISQSDSEKISTNRISEPIRKRDVSPISSKKASSVKDRDDNSSRAPINRQHSETLSAGFKQELEETMRGKTVNERTQRSKREKSETKEEKNKGFGFTFFKSKESKEKEKKSKDAKNEQENEKESRKHRKENLYDEPEISPEIIKQSEPIYEEADSAITPLNPHVSTKPALYTLASPNRQDAWKNHGLQEEEHLENYASIKAAASQNGEQNSYKHLSEEDDDTYDHAFLNDRSRCKKTDENDSKNIYGTASGKEIKIPEADYELQDDEFEELVEYDDAVSMQQMRSYSLQPETGAYEDVDLLPQ